jgi:geranyl-CoA carboxylase beta subunit
VPVIESRADVRSEDFRRNRERMLALVERVRSLERGVREKSGREAARFERRGQLLPRERVSRLLDRGAPFLELSTLAGYRLHDDDGEEGIAGGGTVTGIGFVSGRRVLVTASDSAIKGGTISPMGLRKSLRAQELARENRLPCVNLVESGGANLLYQSELFVEGGRIFANMARLSAAGIPQLTVVHGSSTAGGAYLPGLSDYVVAVRGKARIFLAGPPLVKAATGEDATEEELGGAEMHATVSGTAEYVAQDDAHAIAIVRELVAKLRWDPVAATPPAAARPPRYDAEELLGIVPADDRAPYPARELVARLVDDSDLLEFKAGFGPATVCGHARLEGHELGIVANDGPIDADGAAKAAHFVQACCQSATPIVYLQNTTGYLVGRDAEERGIIKHGAKMIQAVANATVPQLTVIVGGSFGAGNYGMCGRAFDPRFLFAWPNARLGVMGGDQAAKVMELVTRAKLARQGLSVDEDALLRMADALREQLEAESSALFATARLWDDGIVDPRDTRRVLGFALATCREAEARRLAPTTFGVGRM